MIPYGATLPWRRAAGEGPLTTLLCRSRIQRWRSAPGASAA